MMENIKNLDKKVAWIHNYIDNIVSFASDENKEDNMMMLYWRQEYEMGLELLADYEPEAALPPFDEALTEYETELELYMDDDLFSENNQKECDKAMAKRVRRPASEAEYMAQKELGINN